VFTYLLVIKPTRCTNFSNLFLEKTLHDSDSFCVHHQQFFTVHIAMVYVIQVCWQLSSRIRTEFHPDPACKLSANLYDITLLCVQWKTPDDGERNCPKHIEFYSKNKFEKLVHLLCFIIRIYHDARSPECQNCLHTVHFQPENLCCHASRWEKMSKYIFSFHHAYCHNSHVFTNTCTLFKWHYKTLIC